MPCGSSNGQASAGWDAELNRHKGQSLLQQGYSKVAEELYRKARSIAEEQEANLWELRAAASAERQVSMPSPISKVLSGSASRTAQPPIGPSDARSRRCHCPTASRFEPGAMHPDQPPLDVIDARDHCRQAAARLRVPAARRPTQRRRRSYGDAAASQIARHRAALRALS
jgi:hypothetical protein